MSFSFALVFLVAGGSALAAKKEVGARKSPIIFSPAGGVYGTNVSLTLAARSGSPAIRYTIDGTEPNENSPAYSSPLLITNTTLVRAKAFPRIGPSTSVAAEVYTLIDDDLANFSSNIPLGIVNSFGTNIVNERKIEGALQFVAGSDRTKLTSPVDFSGRALLNLRGRASLRYPKGSFTVKLVDGDGDAEAAGLFGFPADADWVLLAPYPDKTLMRDVLGYELHEQMGHWAPRTKFIEVFVNQTGRKLSRRDYAGVYVLVERIKRASKRVDIANLKPDDNSEPRITGGYIFKKDHVDPAGFAMGGEGFGAGAISQSTRAGYPTEPGGFPADPAGFLPPSRATRSSSSSSSSRSGRASRVWTNHLGFAGTRIPIDGTRDGVFRDEVESLKEEESFKTSRTNEFYFVEPEQDEITAVQKAWLKRHLNQLEAALYGPDFTDSAKGYRAYIDPDSFIDYHLIIETTKNVDGFRFSVFYHKDRGGKIKADPIWDWNLSFGNANGKQGWMPEYWLWPQLDNKEYTWYRRLFEDPDFGQRYVDRWSELRTNVFATKRVLARVDEIAALLQESQKRNFEKWPILGRPINPNFFFGATYEEEVNWMKKYIETRLGWIEKQFLPAPGVSTKGQMIELSAARGQILYTLDGSDPRASGGSMAGNALTYSKALQVDRGAKLFARVRENNRWSGPLVVSFSD